MINPVTRHLRELYGAQLYAVMHSPADCNERPLAIPGNCFDLHPSRPGLRQTVSATSVPDDVLAVVPVSSANVQTNNQFPLWNWFCQS